MAKRLDSEFQKATVYQRFHLNLVPSPFVCRSFTAKIVVFHGHPNPHEAAAGYRSPRPNRNTLPTPWIEELWKNA